MITHKQVEAFRMIMITGSATHAAKLLNVSQPAVSRMISNLEHDIGFPLFIRKNRQLKPTYEARLFHDDVERSFIGLERLQRSAEAIRQTRGGKLHLVCIPSLASNVGTELIRRFSKLRPQVKISLDVQPSQRLFEWILSKKCDLGFTTLPINTPEVTTRVLARKNAVCVLPKRHRLSSRPVIHVSDLEGEDFIDHSSSSEFRKGVDTVFGSAKVERKIRYETQTTQTVIDMVSKNLGVSVVEPLFLQQESRDHVVQKEFEPSIPIELVVAFAADNPLVGEVEQFLKVVENYFSNNT